MSSKPRHYSHFNLLGGLPEIVGVLRFLNRWGKIVSEGGNVCNICIVAIVLVAFLDLKA